MPRKPSADPVLAVVAKKTGVSISTVSRALRNAEGIHPETRALVVKAAEAIGYELPQNRIEINSRPHQIMALAQCSTPVSDQHYLAGMSRASIALNLSILSHHVRDEDCASVLDPKRQPTAMRSGLVDGIVLIHRWPPDVAAKLSAKWPCVSIVHHYTDAKIDQIGIDDRGGALALISHLHATGHRNIGFFGLCKDMSWACARFAAYVESLVRLDLHFNEKNVVPISLGEAQSPMVFDANGWSELVMKRTKAGVDAWISASSATGFTLLRFLTGKGVRVPDDVSVASFHSASAPAPPDLLPMTSTAVSDEELGASALRRLVQRFQYPDQSQRAILIPATLVVGETTRQGAAAAL